MEPERLQIVRALLKQKLDWTFLTNEAKRHVVRPLLYHSLQTVRNEVEGKFWAGLHEYYCNNAARNLFLAHELIRLLNLFAANGIQAVPYKGPVLAAAAYGSLSLREFADLDVLAHENDVLKIKELLSTEGYKVIIGRNPEAYYLKHKYHFPFVHPEKNVMIEIHWRFTKRFWSFDLKEDDLWNRLNKIHFAGADVWNFSPEDLLLILSMHGTKHRWNRLAWICDIAQLIQSSPNFDWDWTIKQAKRTGSIRVLRIGLWMAQHLLDVSFSENVRAMLAHDHTAKRISRALQTEILNNHPDNNARFFFIETRERLRDKTRVAIYYLRAGSASFTGLLRDSLKNRIISREKK
jgi:hypothetical protein